LPVVRQTTITISCTPNPDLVGTSVTCTVSVTDNGNGHITPTGTVNWSVSPTNGGSFSPSTSCTLTGGNGASNSCSITYTPSSIGSQTITASYARDANHAASRG